MSTRTTVQTHRLPTIRAVIALQHKTRKGR